jgi:hypothetical protein
VIEKLFADKAILKELETNGYAVIDTAPKVSTKSNMELSEYLVENSGQDDIRTDTVAFLDRQDSLSCGLEHHYDVLMGIANHLNCNYDFSPWPFSARSPATVSKPLTNPGLIQAAEYRENDYYIAHR